MKQRSKKLWSVLLSLALLLSLLPAAVLTAVAEQPDVTYLDADGQQRTCKGTDYTVVTDDTTAWSGGWYVVNSDVTISGTVTATGDVYLILCDTASLTVSGGTGKAIDAANLTIYAQSEGDNAGALNASNAPTENGKDAIGADQMTINGGKITASVTTEKSASGIAANSLTINGGSVTVPNNNSYYGIYGGNTGVIMNGGTVDVKGAHHGIYAQNCPVTINGGTLTATGGKNSINVKGDVTINGGEVTAYAIGNDGDGIFSDGSVTITGGTVTAKRTTETPKSSGICATLDITISGGIVESSGFNHGLYAGNGAVTIKGGDVTANGANAGIFANKGKGVIIEKGSTVTASGGQKAFASANYDSTPVKNAIAGTGWNNTEGTGNRATIPVSDTGRALDFKKVQFLPPVASVDGTAYAVFADAVAAWKTGTELKLLADVETEKTISVTGGTASQPKVLDLNGYGILMTGNGSVIAVNGGAYLTLNDTAAEKHDHYITLSGGRGAAVSDTGTESEACVKVTGGYLTGGTADIGGGVHIVSTSKFTMNGGTIIGNKATNNNGGGVRVDGTFTMNGGAISHNTARYGAGVYVRSGTTFTMTGGSISANTAEKSGGGVHVKGDFTMSGGFVSANKAAGTASDTGRGGGVYAEAGGSFTLSDGYITGNDALFGGGVYVGENCSFNMTGGRVLNNEATGNSTTSGKGGGVYNSGSFTLSGGYIAENNTVFGGGVYDEGTLTMDGSYIVGNDAAQSGGGVLITEKGRFTMSDGVIAGNTADAFGGGVRNWGEFILTGGVIARNEAVYGGGVSNDRDCSFAMSGSVIAENKAKTYGGGVDNDGTFEMTGGTITENESDGYGGGVENDGTFRMSGASVINGNERGDIVFHDHTYITLTDVLAYDIPSVVAIVDGDDKLTDGTFTRYWDAYMTGADVDDYFTSADSRFIVKLTDDTTEAQLVKKPTPPSGGVSGGGSATYPPEIKDAEHGKITTEPKAPAQGDKTKIIATPDDGYELDTVTVKDADGRDVPLTKNDDGSYTFTQPKGKVTITGTFREKEKETGFTNPYVDVHEGDYFYEPVMWAKQNDITNGTDATHFSPNNLCTRAETVTFLWRAEGSPEPNTTVNPFEDVSADAYYYKAVLWAVENGVTKGTDEAHFSPNAPTTREQYATFLYRCAQSHGKGFTGLWSFRLAFPDAGDVSDWAYEAMCWMVMNGVVNGMDGRLNPQGNAVRAHVVSMLYRYQNLA